MSDYQRWLRFLSERYAIPTPKWTEAPNEYLIAARSAIDNGLTVKIVKDPSGAFHVLGKYKDLDEIHVIRSQSFGSP